MSAGDLATAARRWAGLGPYYAMFPTAFADDVVRRHTAEGDLVIDPFAGRGTAVFSAASQNRCAIGIEINPVGYIYARTKVAPATQDAVAERVRVIGRASEGECYKESARALPLFFRRCFAARVRRFLLAARKNLDWRRSSVDRTTMAIILVYLHGKEGAALSNQMRQTKAMSPGYAIRWWEEHEKSAPDIDPVEFIISRLAWRYAKGSPKCADARVYFGNSLAVLPVVAERVERGELSRAKLLFTSPPYYKVTNYHYDQWLRLWMLGGPPNAGRNGNGRRGRFEHQERYEALLRGVFSKAKVLLHRFATVYVRTDAREFTRKTTIKVLREVFPRKDLLVKPRPVQGKTQTGLFGDHGKKEGEVDLVLRSK